MLDLNVHEDQEYTVILSSRSHKHFGQIKNVSDFVTKTNMNNANEASFVVTREVDGEREPLWNKIVDHKYVFIVELKEYYEIKVDVNDEDRTSKSITCTSACECELGQSTIYSLEVNSEIDIKRDDYEPTIFYNEEKPKFSLLNRALSKMPNYKIMHVDESIAKIQRTFSVNEKTVYDFLTGELAQEIGCLFLFDSVNRGIYVYDLNTVCLDCGYRSDFSDVCPECGSKNLQYYGEDTAVYVDTENLTEGIYFTTDTDSIKNCFRLEAGDDNMTAAVINSNPNGSAYIYCFSDEQKDDMSDELVEKLESYDNLVESKKDEYQALMNKLYDDIDKIIYYTSGMMPKREDDSTNAEKEAAKLNVTNLSPIALSEVKLSTSTQTVNSALKNYAKIYINSGKYKIEVNEGEFVYESASSGTWTGNFIVTNYADEEDTAKSEKIEVFVNNDYTEFINQKIKKKIASKDDETGSVYSVLEIDDLSRFKSALELYSLNRLTSFYDAIQSVLDIMTEEVQLSKEDDAYDKFYIPYLDKLNACQSEIDKRSRTIKDYETDKSMTEREVDKIHKELNFESYLGEELYLEFCCYRREDKYSNPNYICDGLETTEIFKKAKEFFETAQKEIYKACQPKHSITSTLNNLFAMKEFKPIAKKFRIGNWIRIKSDDTVYRLRLISVQVTGKDLNKIDVEFSDITRSIDGMSDIESILNKASSMASSYDAVTHQMKNDSDKVKYVDSWLKHGFDATNTRIVNNATEQSAVIDDHGILCRKYDDIEEDYDPCQLKIINNGLYLTDDGWNSIKTALGKYYYEEENGEMTIAYGLMADRIVGDLIIGGQLKIRTKNGSFSIDENGVHMNMGGKPIEDKIDEIDTSLSKTIISVIYEYCITDSYEEEPGEDAGWSATSLNTDSGTYIWSRQKIYYNDGTEKTTSPICITGQTEKTVVMITKQYAQIESQENIPGEEDWVDDIPEKVEGLYLWSRDVVTYSDGSTMVSTAICITGNDGQSSYIHTRYSEYANGNPMTEKPNEKTKYIGICTTESTLAPESYASYTWTKIRGEDGESPILLYIESSSGNMFINGEIGATLTAIAYKNGIDVSSDYPDTSYSWIKKDKEGNLDEEWNENHKEYGRVLDISNNDVYQRSQFSCELVL